jgi:hypothetical protein
VSSMQSIKSVACVGLVLLMLQTLEVHWALISAYCTAAVVCAYAAGMHTFAA